MSYSGFELYLLNWNFQLPCTQGPKVLAEATWSGTVITPSCTICGEDCTTCQGSIVDLEASQSQQSPRHKLAVSKTSPAEY